MGNKTNMTLRVDPDLKAQASALFKELGLDVSAATGLFFRQALRVHGLPFEVKVNEPNEITYQAMEEAERMILDPNSKRFSSIEELFEELDS